MESSNEKIIQDLRARLAWDSRVDEKQITVAVQDHTVVLTGMVRSFSERQAAESDAWAMPGVQSVQNKLVLGPPEGMEKHPDDEIKWNIQSVVTMHSALSDTHVNVVVNGGVVLLSGSVDEYWKKVRIEELTFEIPGVFNVVNILAVVPSNKPLDQAVASDIMAALSRIGTIDLEHITVTVDGGRVVLKGRVPDWNSYASAFNAAKFTRGVTDIINELTIVKE